MANQVFDFGTTAAEKPVKTAVSGPVCTYETFTSQWEEVSIEHPIMVLDNSKEALVHQISGRFLNPNRRTSFTWILKEIVHSEDILRIDERFTGLVEWLGVNNVLVRLEGEAVGDGFAVLAITAVDSTGRHRMTAEDSFLQMVIGRLLTSHPDHNVQQEEQEEEEQDGRVSLTDLPSIKSYLTCAGNTLPKGIREWAERNLALTGSSTISAEERRHAQRALSIMMGIQWKANYFPPIDPVQARKILDEELYGLDSVKQRIIETIIQINRTHTLPFYGLLLAGPAGIGKSQLAYAVARILKLPWTSLDMSAIRDPEALTGSPRVYSNAKPGRIMEAFAQAGSSNLVFIINELDKADTAGAGGSPADALLTLLDNLGYTDNYMECMIPTTGVYPIATANDKSRISEPLMTRFAVIDIPDYTHEEKKAIFSRFSLPKVLSRMHLQPQECVVLPEAVDVIIERYADQPGCRDLEQAAEHLAANALYRIETTHVPSVTFTAQMTAELLDA